MKEYYQKHIQVWRMVAAVTTTFAGCVWLGLGLVKWIIGNEPSEFGVARKASIAVSLVGVIVCTLMLKAYLSETPKTGD